MEKASTENSGERILVLLEQQLEDYSEISSYIKEHDVEPGNIYLESYLFKFGTTLENNAQFRLQLLQFLDVVNFYSFIIYDDPDYFVKHTIRIILSSRTVDNTKGLIGESGVDAIIFEPSKKEDAENFVAQNKLLLSLYIFSLVSQLLH